MDNKELIKYALKAKNNAKVDISGYYVGAALLTCDNKVYLGCNIEDKTIPNLSICAERAAYINAISNGDYNFKKIAIVGGTKDNIDKTLSPCGVCLQYMLNYDKDIKVVTYINDELKELKLTDFLNIPYNLK
ncbi:MAG: cytidine deaminase [Clostridia bacterium]